MDILLDENLSEDVAAILNAAGHQTKSIRELGLAGSSDEMLWSYCRNNAVVLITLDSYFSDQRRFPPAEGFGLLWLRTPKEGWSFSHLCTQVLKALQSFDSGSIRGKLLIVDKDKIRVRGKP